MSEISYSKFNDLDNAQIMQRLGNYIKHHRVHQNRSQEQLAYEIGIARSTLSLFERGENTSVVVFIQILRALNLLDKLAVFELQQQVAPSPQNKQTKKKEMIIKPKTEHGDTQESDWAFY